MGKKDYIAVRETWLSHECRFAKAGERFSTEFPQVNVGGKMVDIRLGDGIKLVEAAEEVKLPKGGKAAKAGDDLS